ncbi:hypothetical protein PR202_gb29459 [Eleusine coracana subsp. coracana]|uniref:Uncharacterized protein n=1 Tax=Eleusine coracana subsp. coracana TaxID=191504 RepID=A0AAV5FZG3_ELECO|nr:hypothetical protein PR202_gb29459 [Eleusine coracana subsp. coracana]
MKNSSTPNFTNLLNSAISSSDSQNPENSQQNHGFPASVAMPYPPYQFDPNLHPHYPPNFNPFGVQAGYQQFQTSSYHGVPFPSSFGAFQSGSAFGPSSPVGSVVLFGGAGGSGSRGDEYSPASSPTIPA